MRYLIIVLIEREVLESLIHGLHEFNVILGQFEDWFVVEERVNRVGCGESGCSNPFFFKFVLVRCED